MYIDVETIITAGSLIGALGVIGGMLISAYKLFRKPAEIETHVEKLEKAHEEDIRRINEVSIHVPTRGTTAITYNFHL